MPITGTYAVTTNDNSQPLVYAIISPIIIINRVIMNVAIFSPIAP